MITEKLSSPRESSRTDKKIEPRLTGRDLQDGRQSATVLSMRASEIPNFEQLSDKERVALADEILGSLKNPGALPLPLAHRAELDRRWAAYKANPGVALT